MFGAGGLAIDTPSPDALCPPLEQTRSAVESRLGAVELEGTWRATYVLVHRAEGDRVALKLRDPKGAVRLEREFAAEGGSCATLAQVIALVLERYFLRPESNLEPTESTTTHERVASIASFPLDSDVPPPSGPAVAMRTPSIRLLGPSAFAIRSALHSQFALDLGLWGTTAWLAPSIGLTYRSSDHWSLGVGVGYDLLDHDSAVESGWGSIRRVPTLLQAKRHLVQLGSVRLNLGAEMLGLYEHVQTSGLVENGAASRLVPGLGLRLGAELLPGRPRVGPFAELSSAMLLRWLSNPFEVDHAPAFVPPTFVLGLHFGIRTIL